MQSVLLVLPDFMIILLGTLLTRRFGYPREFWKWAEKIVFNVLFPPLLFLSVAQSEVGLGNASRFLAVAIATMLLAVLASALIPLFIPAKPLTHASVFQCGFRFNTYIGFALVVKLAGTEGFALMALLIALWVPISNTIAVSVLAQAVARNEGAVGFSTILRRTIRSVVRNPLIIATVLGLIVNVTGLTLPFSLTDFLKGLGKASLAMGLLCIGAGLKLTEAGETKALLATSVIERLVIVPLIAIAMGLTFGLGRIEFATLLVFAALPTAQSCYVMTASMGGDATSVANATALQTLVAMATLTFWSAALTEGLI